MVVEYSRVQFSESYYRACYVEFISLIFGVCRVQVTPDYTSHWLLVEYLWLMRYAVVDDMELFIG